MICECCAKEFERPNSRGPTPKYCSAACRQAMFRERHPERDASEQLANLVANYYDLVAPVFEGGAGLRTRLESEGWSPTAAEHLAMQMMTAQLELAKIRMTSGLLEMIKKELQDA